MTPKQQAEKLLDKFFQKQIGYGPREKEMARQNLFLALEIITNVAQDDSHFKHTEFSETHQNYKSYWKLVKQEVEKIKL